MNELFTNKDFVTYFSYEVRSMADFCYLCCYLGIDRNFVNDSIKKMDAIEVVMKRWISDGHAVDELTAALRKIGKDTLAKRILDTCYSKTANIDWANLRDRKVREIRDELY